MLQPIHILYLPGFGQKNDTLRLRSLKLWRYANVTTELLPMKWENSETYEQKIARIDQAIDRAEGKRIVLIGESAGGSMAVCMYARRPEDFHKVMTICGKNNHPETVSEEYYEIYPGYRMVIGQLADALQLVTDAQRRSFVSIHPLYDPVVPVRDTLLPGCRRIRLWAVGHAFVILLALTVLSPIVVRAAKG